MRARSSRGWSRPRPTWDLSGTDAGHQVVFDMRPGRTWGEQVFREERAVGGVGITVWGV